MLVGQAAREPGRGDVELVGQLGQAVFALRDARAVEAVGLEDVGAGLEVGLVDAADHVGPRDAEQVVVALEVLGVAGEALAAIVGFDQLAALDHGAHGAVEDQDALREKGAQLGAAIGLPAGSVGVCCGHASLQSMTGAGSDDHVLLTLCPGGCPRVGERR
jgi:hypothetical protein